jgi:hypothetical protein
MSFINPAFANAEHGMASDATATSHRLNEAFLMTSSFFTVNSFFDLY